MADRPRRLQGTAEAQGDVFGVEPYRVWPGRPYVVDSEFAEFEARNRAWWRAEAERNPRPPQHRRNGGSWITPAWTGPDSPQSPVWVPDAAPIGDVGLDDKRKTRRRPASSASTGKR